MRNSQSMAVLVEHGLSSTAGRRVVESIDLFGSATTPLEVPFFLDSFLPSLMPRNTALQGLAAGLNLVSARAVGNVVDAAGSTVLNPSAQLPSRLAVRAAELAVGQGLSQLPEHDDETLWRSGARSGGRLLRAAAVTGALYDTVEHLRRQSHSASPKRILLGGLLATGGVAVWASRRMSVREREIKRWPVVQEVATGRAIRIGAIAAFGATAIGRSYRRSERALVRYSGPGVGKQTLAIGANAGLWAAGTAALYNAGIGYIGRSNETIEAEYSSPPTSPLLSGGPGSVVPYTELGLQGRRYVSDVVAPEVIEKVIGEPAVAHPIRTFVGFNTAPMYSSGRAELALAELDRTNAFDRSYLLLISPTGTGWVDQTVVAAAEFLTKGDIATCAIQYGRFPSFLCVQKVGLGRIQFRLLLWGIKQRLAERPPERRPKVLVFGESLGAWTSSDVVMGQGISGFDHYGIDRALWMGLPALAKWSRNGMASGSSDLVPEGTVGVFDCHEELEALDEQARERLRAVILSHDNDPIAALRPELAIRRPEWLRGDRGRNVPEGMDWIPLVTLCQVAVDAANAMVTVPGDFRSFGHDYRGDTTRFVRDAFHLPVVGEDAAKRIDEALSIMEIDRKKRIASQGEGDVYHPETERSFAGGVPLESARAPGPRWFGGRLESETEANESAGDVEVSTSQ